MNQSIALSCSSGEKIEMESGGVYMKETKFLCKSVTIGEKTER